MITNKIYIIQNYLYNVKNKINTKRLNKEFFIKNSLEFSEIFQNQEKLFVFMRENKLLEEKLQNSSGENPNDRNYIYSTCKYCDEKTKFIDVNKGYKKFCNLSCSAKFNTKGRNKGIKKNKALISFKELVLNHLIGTNNSRTIIETQRLNKKWFYKNYLEQEYKLYMPYINNHKLLQQKLIKEKIYHIFFKENTNTQEKNKCLFCNKESKFVSVAKGYKKYCSRQCASKHSLNLELRKQTMLLKYGVENSFQMESTRKKCTSKSALQKKHQTKLNNIDEKGLNSYERGALKAKVSKLNNIDENGLNSYERSALKMKETNEKLGNWITEDQVKDFKDYTRLVWRYTNQNDLSVLENIEKRGIQVDNYHLDHKYSIFQGFKENMPANIIGNICNLEMLVSGKNLSKNRKCSITKEELLSSFEK